MREATSFGTARATVACALRCAGGAQPKPSSSSRARVCEEEEQLESALRRQRTQFLLVAAVLSATKRSAPHAIRHRRQTRAHPLDRHARRRPAVFSFGGGAAARRRRAAARDAASLHPPRPRVWSIRRLDPRRRRSLARASGAAVARPRPPKLFGKLFGSKGKPDKRLCVKYGVPCAGK